MLRIRLIRAATVAALLLMTSFQTTQAEVRAVEALTWTRNHEPVLITGERVSQFLGAPANELFAYAYHSGGWHQIPFQIDEVTESGVYAAEDGMLDANDELVLMATDIGEQATAKDWINDPDSENYVRYEIAVTNPLDITERGWIYLFRSAQLISNASDYVQWDEIENKIITDHYTAGFSPAVHPLIDSLFFSGSAVDILDRMKARIELTCTNIITFDLSLTEENIEDELDFTPTVDGSVRTGGGSLAAATWAYPSMFLAQYAIDLTSFEDPLCGSPKVNQIRLSADWANPTDTGMAPATYYDANHTAGEVVDGAPDTVESSPFSTWRQVSGGLGSALQIIDLSLGSGVVENYYKDDLTGDPSDTGDGRSFGDAGVLVRNPEGNVSVKTTTYLFKPGQPNIGNIFAEYEDHPLLVTLTAQSLKNYIYLPLVSK